MPPLSAVSEILRSLAKGISKEAIPMSKVAWDMKYSGIVDAVSTGAKTGAGQQAIIDSLKTATKDKGTKNLLNEYSDLMKSNIFDYESALKAGVVKEPISPERSILDSIFGSK